ncbi:MAG: hypothetical protein JOZ43_01520 [Acidobacteriales bacterium]|nr:hypothetical protein [Terriglobales bacterium]
MMPTRLGERQETANTVSGFSRVLAYLPGADTGEADLDPARVLTATLAGASFGCSLGGVVLLCIPILFSVFSVGSRLGGDRRKGGWVSSNLATDVSAEVAPHGLSYTPTSGLKLWVPPHGS